MVSGPRKKREREHQCKHPSNGFAGAERRRGTRAFTLIELLIVIVILGILAAIVVFAVQNLTSSSSQASCGSD